MCPVAADDCWSADFLLNPETFTIPLLGWVWAAACGHMPRLSAEHVLDACGSLLCGYTMHCCSLLQTHKCVCCASCCCASSLVDAWQGLRPACATCDYTLCPTSYCANCASQGCPQTTESAIKVRHTSSCDLSICLFMCPKYLQPGCMPWLL